jgi:hypothetical protein
MNLLPSARGCYCGCMSLPTSLLTAVAGHACFTGCFKPDRAAAVCVDPAQPLAATLHAVCSECLSFRVGALTTALGVGVTTQAFADDLSAQVQGLRGYVWSTSGYWANGGFWVSAAYFGNGLFLVDGSRNGIQRTDLDMLIRAFRAGIVSPDDPRMLSASQYTSEVVYVDMSQLIGLVRDKQDLLASPACRKTPAHGYQRASILEFIPMARSNSSAPSALPSNASPSNASPSNASPPKALPASASPSNTRTWPPPAILPAAAAPPTVRSATPSHLAVPAPAVAPASGTESTRCPDCGEEIKERLLFTGTYVGCLC